MFTVAQLAHPEPEPLTGLVDAAAAVESRLLAAEARVREMQRELQSARQRQDLALGFIKGIRASHRRRSHAATGRVIRDAISTLDAGRPVVRPLF